MRILQFLLAMGMLASVAYSDEVLHEGHKSFQNSLHKLIRAKCALCHGGEKKAEVSGPAFAVEDVVKSYNDVIRRVRFDNIELSQLVERGSNGHCQQYTKDDCGATKAEMKKGVQDWWDNGQKKITSNRATSEALELPVVEKATPKAFVPIRWDLSKLTQLKGTYLEMEVQPKYREADGDAKGAYRFKRPRLVTTRGALRISDLRFNVNGREESTANQFVAVDTVIASSPIPKEKNTYSSHPLLSAHFSIVLQDRKAGDTVSVSFGKLEPADVPKCKDLDKFETKVLAQIESHDCRSCHGGGKNAATSVEASQRFSMAGTNAELCARVFARSEKGNPRRSVFYLYGYRQAGGHPEVTSRSQTVADDFVEWMRAETDVAQNQGTAAPPLKE